MLYISFSELPFGRAVNMVAKNIRTGINKGKGILQLIPEAICSAALVKGGSCKNSAGDCLIQEPAVDKNVDGFIGGLDLYCTQNFFPVCFHE